MSAMAFLRRLSIRSQLFILAACTIIVILVVVMHTYAMMSGMITRSHEEYVKQTVSEIKKNVASNHDVIYRIMQDISYNQDVQDYLVETDKLVRYDKFTKLNKYMSGQKELKEGIEDIIISGNNGTWIDLYGGNRYVIPLRKQLANSKVNGYYAGMLQFDTKLYGPDKKLVFATSITYSQQGELFNRNIGTAFFIVDAAAVVSEQDYTSQETDTQIYLLDRSNQVIASNSSAQTGSDFKGMQYGSPNASNRIVQWKNRSYVVETEALPDIDGTILSMVPENELLRDLLDIRRQELIILGIALLVLAVPFMFIINNILRPLKRLIFFITTIRRGDLLEIQEADRPARLYGDQHRRDRAEQHARRDRPADAEPAGYEYAAVRHRAGEEEIGAGVLAQPDQPAFSVQYAGSDYGHCGRGGTGPDQDDDPRAVEHLPLQHQRLERGAAERGDPA